MDVVENFLREGIPLRKIDGMRPLLEKNNFSLCARAHMSQFIPLVLEEEKKRLKAVVNQGPIGIIFDGTFGEAIAIVVRFLDGWVIRQRLVRLHTVAKAVTGQDLTRFINHCLANEYQINGDMVVAAMRDGAATNGVAVRNLKVPVACSDRGAGGGGGARHTLAPKKRGGGRKT